MENGRAGRSDRRRNFGADAKPARKRKTNYGVKGEMGGKKGPIRERAGGQIFGYDDGDDYNDNDVDFMRDFKESDEEDAV